MEDTNAATPRGWSWFERSETNTDTQTQSGELPDTGRELRLSYARCFAGPDGEKVLKHLRVLTLERAFGPDVDAELLRHMEGQRQLVSYILAQFERGRQGD